MRKPTLTAPPHRCRLIAPRLLSSVALVVAAGVASGQQLAAQDREPGDPAADADVPRQLNSLEFSPRGGPPGTEVVVRGSGLPVRTTLAVGFGLLRSGYEILADVETDADGELSLTVQIPASVERDRRYYFLVTDTHQQPLTVSDAFHVTGADGVVTVEGRITGARGECTSLRGENDERYNLLGDDAGELASGRRVVVEGRIAEESGCPDGLTIDVRRITPGP